LPKVPYWPPGLRFKYRNPAWLAEPFECEFTIAQSGNVELPDIKPITIGKTTYKMGIGGLHSQESDVSYIANDERCLFDVDVASYYPAIMINQTIEPFHLKGLFGKIYRGWRDDRLKAKHAGDKKTADMLKIVLNGTFGKLFSKYSIFYAPTEGLQVTITGQLALLQLIGELEKCSIPVISANTDGIVLNPLRSQVWFVLDIIERWESLTGFEMERTDYSAVYSRDVNNYIAIKTNGEVKTKGCFAPPEPVGGSWPSPTAQIVNDAVIAQLTKGIRPEFTIQECKDIRRFVSVRKVTGGGYYSHYEPLPNKVSKKVENILVEKFGVEFYTDALAIVKARREYLGKTVRWYYALDTVGHIQNTKGGLVATTEGCKPLMELPNNLPIDINYQWYIDTANKILDGFINL
jgi:hypothetical protein